MPSPDKAGQSRADPAGVGIHGLASTSRPGSVPNPGSFASLSGVNGGEWAAVPARPPAPSDLERAVAEAAGRSTPTDDNESEDRRLWWRVVALILILLVLV
jgi:hypothetical protein